METIENKIRRYIEKRDNVIHSLAMLQVGCDKKESPEEIMRKILADALFRFYGIPFRPTE